MLARRRDRRTASGRSLDPGRPERKLEVSIRDTRRSAALLTLNSSLVTCPGTPASLETRALVFLSTIAWLSCSLPLPLRAGGKFLVK